MAKMNDYFLLDIESVKCDYPFWELESDDLLNDQETFELFQIYYFLMN